MAFRRPNKARIEALERRVAKSREVRVVMYDRDAVSPNRRKLLRNLPRGTRKVYLIPRNGRDPTLDT